MIHSNVSFLPSLASRDLAQTSYFMATNSLHLTTMCLMYRPTVVACACIHLACKWSSWEVSSSPCLVLSSMFGTFLHVWYCSCSNATLYQIPKSKEGKDWFLYVDEKVTLEELEQLTAEFIAILDKCPSRLKRRIMTGGIATGHSSADSPSSSNAVGASSTPNATFSSPMMTSPREEKPLPHSSVPSMGYHQPQQHHVPSATVTSNQTSSMVVKEERREEHDPVPTSAAPPAMIVPSIHSTVQESRPSPQNIPSQVKVEMKETVIPTPSSSFPSSHHYQRDHSATGAAVGVPSPSSAVINSHPQPIVLKIPLKGPSVHDSGASSLGYRERSDSHGSSKSKNHHSSSSQTHHAGDTHSTNNWPSSGPKIDSMKIKIVGGQVFKKDDEEKRKEDERYREEDRRKRKRDEFERGGSRRDSRDDKRSKDRSSKHHSR